MTVAELITMLEQLPRDLPITVIHMDFPHNVREIERCMATRYEDHWHESFYPEVEDEPVHEIAVIR